jgi:hypothetical protein
MGIFSPPTNLNVASDFIIIIYICDKITKYCSELHPYSIINQVSKCL